MHIIKNALQTAEVGGLLHCPALDLHLHLREHGTDEDEAGSYSCLLEAESLWDLRPSSPTNMVIDEGRLPGQDNVRTKATLGLGTSLVAGLTFR